MHDWQKATGILALGFLVILYIARALKNRNPHPLPPGPPGLPWVGNVIGLDRNAPWLTYAEWARTYGDLLYTRVMGRDIIIINSEKVANDLLGIRSMNYSDRAQFIVMKWSGQQWNTVFLPYGDQWRLHRRFFHQTFGRDDVHRFSPYQHRRACRLLQQLLEAPEKLRDHVFEYTASVILNSAYNYNPTSRKDDLIEMVESVSDFLVHALRFEVTVPLCTLPWLIYLPSWLPGMSFKREMAKARMYTKEYLSRPFEYSLQRSSGGLGQSMVHDALQSMEIKGVSPDESWMQGLKEASGTAFMAGLETSNAVLMSFFLVMLANPTVQEKAQAQIDAVVGRDRLPTINDRPLLPFIDAIFREMIRYNPVSPLFPHAAMDDGVYNGYHIPKGALIVTNLWSMAHDESRYPNPHAFIPERFLNDDGSLKPDDMQHITFGFGRRMCAGRHFADASLWAVMAKVLSVFKILPLVDEHGVEVPVEPKFSSGVIVHPLPFRCRIVPRCEGMDAERLAHLIAATG